MLRLQPVMWLGYLYILRLLKLSLSPLQLSQMSDPQFQNTRDNLAETQQKKMGKLTATENALVQM